MLVIKYNKYITKYDDIITAEIQTCFNTYSPPTSGYQSYIDNNKKNDSEQVQQTITE